jgi:hypothetical protein
MLYVIAVTTSSTESVRNGIETCKGKLENVGKLLHYQLEVK